ncbi:MAG: hypothetical protein U0325_31300 [Polyangiales bacterium]
MTPRPAPARPARQHVSVAAMGGDAAARARLQTLITALQANLATFEALKQRGEVIIGQAQTFLTTVEPALQSAGNVSATAALCSVRAVALSAEAAAGHGLGAGHGAVLGVAHRERQRRLILARLHRKVFAHERLLFFDEGRPGELRRVLDSCGHTARVLAIRSMNETARHALRGVRRQRPVHARRLRAPRARR